MPPAPLPDNEDDRLGKLRSYAILDTPPEAAFDRVTNIARRLFDTPISLISLVDAERQWFKSRYGLDATETPRDLAFCAHAILDDTPLVVEDATRDVRFADNPLVTAAPEIRFYAGAPLVTHDGYNLGTLCVIDTRPRTFGEDERMSIAELAQIAIDEIELREAARTALRENAELVQANACKDEFIALVSHELRTPLTSILGAVTLIDGGAAGALPGRAVELSGIARRNTEHLKKLVDNLLDFQKHRAGMLEFDFQPASPAQIVRDAIDDMSGFAAAQQVRVAIAGNLDDGPGMALLADPLRLRQVFANLLSNAIKFSAAGDTVEIGIERQAETVTVFVADKGPGIPAEFQPHMFRMFAKASGHGQPAGTGVGLALCKAIVEAHGGTIGFSTAPDRGTTFRIDLPLQHSVLSAMQERLSA